MADQCRVVLVTVPDAHLAEKLARELVEHRLAACVNEVPGLTSHYFWEGKQHKDKEMLLVIKTRAGVVSQVVQFVKEHHTSKIPEIVSLPVDSGDKAYLEWVVAATNPARVQQELKPEP